MLQPPDLFHNPLLGATPTAPFLSYTEGLQNWTKHSRAGSNQSRGAESPLLPAAHTAFDENQDAFGFLGCKHARIWEYMDMSLEDMVKP